MIWFTVNQTAEAVDSWLHVSMATSALVSYVLVRIAEQWGLEARFRWLQSHRSHMTVPRINFGQFFVAAAADNQ